MTKDEVLSALRKGVVIYDDDIPKAVADELTKKGLIGFYNYEADLKVAVLTEKGKRWW